MSEVPLYRPLKGNIHSGEQGLVCAISEELYKTEVTIEVETNEEGAVFHIQVRRIS